MSNPIHHLEVSYVRKGTRYHGDVKLNGEELVTFSGIPYSELLKVVNRQQVSTGLYRLLFKFENTAPLLLDEMTCFMIRHDIVRAIRVMAGEKESLDINDVIDPTLPIRVSYDTAADAFGEYVYVRRRGYLIECPFCGRWETGQGRCDAESFPSNFSLLVPFCLSDNKRQVQLAWELQGAGWARYPTHQLRLSGVDRLYLPRAWNEGRGWIPMKDFRDKFDKFIAEREKAIEETK